MSATVIAPSKTMNIVIWVLRVLMAALFLFAAFGKLTSNPMMVEEFGKIGLGDGFRYLTAVLEVFGALALVTPMVSGFGALLLLCVDLGAFFAQVFVLHGDWIHTIVIGAILAALVYLQRTQIQARLGF
jgi:putative oxidoreductase